ncbi:MAG: response regulator transcription factor [Rhodothermaceae bacterium]|nr:response regulator transcription factor [Rhodothermaceae bacterium]
MSLDAPTRLWLVEDDALFRQALTDLFADADDVDLVGVFGACEPALDAIETEGAPDVVLLDLGLPGLSGTEGARRLKARSPATQLVILTIHEDDDAVFDALCAGASGYLLKNATGPEILQAVREVRAGGVPLTPPVARRMLTHFRQIVPAHSDYGLTEREREILGLLAEGLAQKEIADRLFLSPHTVDTHLRNLYAKLHVRTGIAAVSKALRERLIG